MPNTPAFSLLWPAGAPLSQHCVPIDPQCVRDLEFESTLAALLERPRGRSAVHDMCLTLCTDPAVITYRQDIFADLWQTPDFRTHLEALLPDLRALEMPYVAGDRKRVPLQDVAWRLGELEHLVTCVNGLHAVFAQAGARLRATGWQALRERVTHIAQDAVYQHLCQALPEMVRLVRAKASVTIGVNLDTQLRPVAATLLAVNDQQFTTSTFLERLFGSHDNAFKGMGPLHTVPTLAQLPTGTGGAKGHHDMNPLMVPLFHDVARVLESVCQPVARALRQYDGLHSGFLATLHGDLTFYLGAVRLIARLQQNGLPVCRPVLAPMDERVCELQEAYNLNLALQQMAHTDAPVAVVTNDVAMDAQGRIGIITGPNRGGKTTYTQMVGLCQLLAQLGLWVPAARARISPVDNVYTHYPVAEQAVKGTGRFGDEAQRLRQIFAQSTRHSLILLNESLASTSAGESLYMAKDIVRLLRRLGVRALFATHLHALAADVAELNASIEGESRIVSLVASREERRDGAPQRSYKIVPGTPLGHSYAREIAAQYGMSYDQLTELLQQRGMV